MSILLGFEIPSGRRVEIPDEGHAAFFGQTQLSGKTTLIEAITYRAPANVKAVAFITKRGEGSFLTARTIPPYFSEPTNDPEQPLWRWVSAILEASQQRKLRFEEAWIIRACEEPRRAKCLADVHANIKALLEGEYEDVHKGRGKRAKTIRKCIRKPVTGINNGIYTSLNAYFDILMPQLDRMPYTKTLDLRPGLNVMDLREYSMEAQGMVIRSVMEYVYRNERNCRVVVPEAQDFVPQGKNSPVKMACETLIRKGAADKNFMWLDSQDMAAVDKVMLRAVSILGCGVQGEAHEMGRAIAHLFGAATRLTPRDIGSLEIGQFYLRVAGGNVTKVYVQPAWMDSEIHARAIAMGQESVSTARQILRAFKRERHVGIDPNVPQMLQVQTLERESPDAEEENGSSDVLQKAGQGQPGDAVRVSDPVSVAHSGDRSTEGDDINAQSYRDRAALANLEENQSGAGRPSNQNAEAQKSEEAMPAEKTKSAMTLVRSFMESDRVVWNPEFHKALGDLISEHQTLIEAHDALAARVRELERQGTYEDGFCKGVETCEKHPEAMNAREHGVALPHANSGNGLSFTVPQLDYIYKYVKAHAEKDPGLAELLIRRPELRVKLEREVIEMDGKSLRGSLAILIHEKFFDGVREFAEVRKELIRRGMLASKSPNKQVSDSIQGLVELGFLTKENDGYQAVAEMKVSIARA